MPTLGASISSDDWIDIVVLFSLSVGVTHTISNNGPRTIFVSEQVTKPIDSTPFVLLTTRNAITITVETGIGIWVRSKSEFSTISVHKANISLVSDEPFALRVQKGQVPGHSILTSYGLNPSIDSTIPADLWDFPPEPIYTFSTDADIDSISSDNAGDFQPILILGLDIDFKEVTMVISLNGQTRVPLSTNLIRTNVSFVLGSQKTLGNVYIYENTTTTGGIPDDTTKVRSYLDVSRQRSVQSMVTIPAGKTGFFLGLDPSIQRQPAAGGAIFSPMLRVFGGIAIPVFSINLSSTGTSYAPISANAFETFIEKTDLFSNIEVTANGTGVSSIFRIHLVDNNFI